MTDDGVNNRCRYVFRPERWENEHGTPSQLTQEELTDDGVWHCPHPVHADRDRCLFHLPHEEKDSSVVREALIQQIDRQGKAEKQFIGARFGDLNLDYVILESGDNHLLDLRHARFDGNVTLQSAIVRQPFRLDGSIFRGDARFIDTVFEGEGYFSRTTFHDDAYFINATFELGGYFYAATFHGDTDFSWAIFDGADFIEATFQRVHFREAVFEARADFKRAEFHHAMFWGVRFDESGLFAQSTFDTRMNFCDAEFRGTARFVELELISETCYVDLTESQISAGTLSQPDDGEVVYNLEGATVGDVTLSADSPTVETLDFYRFLNTTFDGFDFGYYRDALNATGWDIHDVIRSVPMPDSVDLDPTAGDLESTYLKAKNGANNIGDVKAAAEFFRKEMVYRRRQHALLARDGTASVRERAKAAWRWSTNALLDVTSGYGERSSRVVATSVAVILAFTVLFALFRPTQPYGSQYGYLILSLESFITLVLSGGETVDNPTIRLLAQLEGFSGAFLIALFVFTLTRSIHR